MVYVEPLQIGWEPMLEAWLPSLPKGFSDKFIEQVKQLFHWLVPPCLRCATKVCKQLVQMSEMNLVQALMRLFRSLMEPFDDEKKFADIPPQNVHVMIDCFFLLALVRG